VSCLWIPLLLLQAPGGPPGERTRLAFARLDPAAAAAPADTLADLGRSGVDVVLVPWPGDGAALGRLVEAGSALRARSADVPLLVPLLRAPFDPDPVESFFARVPPPFRLRILDRPLVWLEARPDAPEGAALLFKARWRERFGEDPYVVAERSWGPGADRVFEDGASWKGPLTPDVASVGPGSTTPFRDRQDGAFYEKAWTGVLKSGCRWVLIESWTDEGTGVGEHPARGRKYVEITRRFLRHFHVGEKVPLPKGPFTGAKRAYFHSVFEPNAQGLSPLSSEEADFKHHLFMGAQILATRERPGRTRRVLAFDVDDSFAYFEAKDYRLELEYLDVGEGIFAVEYDAMEREPKRAGEVRLAGSGEWKVTSLALPKARFGNQLPGGADLRVAIDGRGLMLKRAVITPR
jgi:hypothetical protein